MMLLFQSVNMMESKEEGVKNKILAKPKYLSYSASKLLLNFVVVFSLNNVNHSPHENVLFFSRIGTVYFNLAVMSFCGTSNNLQLNAGVLSKEYPVLSHDWR